MLLALLAAIGSVAFGALLATLPGVGPSVVGRIRTFALIAAITVVVGHLLPEAIEEIGLAALAAMMLGLALPTAIERIVRHRISHSGGQSRLALELSFGALVLHHIGDGLALAVYGEGDGASLDVVLALVAHTVPVIAVVVLEFTVHAGRRAAFHRALILAIAIVVGVGLGHWFVTPSVTRVSPWIGAVFAGLLLHVITHDLESNPPESSRDRFFDLAIALLGVAIPVATFVVDAHLLDAMETVVRRGAVPLAAGLVLDILAFRYLKNTRIRSILFGETKSKRETLAFLLARKGLRFQTIGLSVAFLGPALTLLSVISCLAIALLGSKTLADHSNAPTPELRLNTITLVGNATPFAIGGATLFGFVSLAPDESFGEWLGGTVALVASLLGPTPLAIPSAGLLITRGIPNSILLGALSFASMDATTLRWTKESHLRRRQLLGVVFVGALLTGGLAEFMGTIPPPEYEYSPVAVIAAVAILAICMGYDAWILGARGYLAETNSLLVSRHHH